MTPENFTYFQHTQHTHPTLCSLILTGPSGVRALPLAAVINVGGHYFLYYSTWGCSLTAVVKIPEGVVVGIQIFAWAPN